MSDFFIDHGVYSVAGSFSAGTSGSSTTLTLTTPGGFTGRLCPGMLLAGTGITTGTYITAITVNAAFVVTSVTMSAAMTVAAATTITPSGAGLPAVVPTWGSPQEGDGTVTGSTAPAVCVGSIVFTGSPAGRSAGTVTFAGVVVTPTYSDVNDTQANNLATAINASTAAGLTFPAQTGNIASGYLKAVFYARGPAGGAAAGTCEVMCRIATTAFNAAVITGASWNGGGTVTYNNFNSAGVAGPWGVFFNNYALPGAASASVSAAGTYGGVVATHMGAVADGDNIFVRTKRGGSNIKVLWPAATCNVVTRAKGTLSLPLDIIFDNGIKWSGDAGVFIWEMNGSLNFGRTFSVPATAGVAQVWAGTLLTSATTNWRIDITGVPVTANYNFSMGGSYAAATFLTIDGLQVGGANGAVLNNANSTFGYFLITPSMASTLPLDYPALLVKNLLYFSQGTVGAIAAIANATYPTFTRAENCVFDHAGLAVTSNDAFLLNLAAAAIGRFEAVNCRWINFPAASHQSGFQKFTSNATVKLTDCQYDNIMFSGGTGVGGMLGSNEAGANSELLRSISVTSICGNRPFVYENSRLSFAWIDSAAPKTADSFLPDGVTNFSIRTAVTTQAGKVTKSWPVVFPPLTRHNTLSSGTRTAKLKMLVDNNLRTALGSRDPKNDELWITITYLGTDALVKTVTSRAAITDTPASLSAGTSGDWSATSYDVNGGSHTYTAFEITVSCPNVQTLTEMRLAVSQGFQGTSVYDIIFIAPEWTLT